MSIRPSTKIKIGLPVAEIKYLAKGNVLTYEQVKTTYHDMLLYVLDELLIELEAWINKFVPKDKGQLRDNLIYHLKTSYVKIGLMRIILGTDIWYAPDVDAMSTSQVRHDVDPEAIGGYNDAYIDYANERAHTILERAIAEYFEGTGQLVKKIKGGL